MDNDRLTKRNNKTSGKVKLSSEEHFSQSEHGLLQRKFECNTMQHTSIQNKNYEILCKRLNF